MRRYIVVIVVKCEEGNKCPEGMKGGSHVSGRPEAKEEV